MSEESNQNDAIIGRNEESCFKSCKCRGIRFYFVFSGFLGMCFIFALRVNMSIAIVAMVNNTVVYGEDKNRSKECLKPQAPNVINRTDEVYKVQKDGEFTWSPTIQGVILGSFYYGYSIFQIPGGRLAEIYNSKWTYGIGACISAVLSLLIPIATRRHVALLIAIRTVQGLAQGVTLPAMYSLIGQWATDSEKTLIATVILSGMNIGTVIGVPVSALLCNSDIFGGWPAVFYSFGLIGCIYFFIWMLTVMETPRNCSCMTPIEVNYITLNQSADHSKKLPPIPWLQIVTFGPYWAIIFSQIVGDWTFFLILNDLPIFYSTILHLNIEENGLLCSFPFLLQSILGCLVGYLSDQLIRRNIVTPTLARKICNTFGCLGSATGLFISSVSGCNVIAHICAFTLIMAAGGFFYSSYMVACLDLSPEYAGTLSGIANTLSNLTGFLTPLFVGALTNQHQTLARWHIVFFLTIALLVLATVLYHLFSTAEKQDWDSDFHKQRCSVHRKRISYVANFWRKRHENSE